MEPWVETFTSACLYRMEESERMIRICLNRLPEPLLWKRPNPASNSPGNLILHLCGNLRQYIISGLGGAPDHRDRESEFAETAQGSKAALWEQLRSVLEQSRTVIQAQNGEQLLDRHKVQGFEFSGLGMALHAVEHLSYHTGQLAYLLKSATGEDLGFYDGTDLNKHNE